jgi:radical SAM superfamily enzyme YgiQ (UPF0313 family)
MRIALVAMSGVRVRSERLRELGVTLPGFVERGQVIASLPSLGLLTLAGATPDEHELAYFESADVDARRLADGRWDLVALSTFTAQAPEAYALADECRRLGLRVALGGLHATVCPEEALGHADHVFAGEGEEIWPEFLRDLGAGTARRLYDARGRSFDLGASPAPRYELLDLARYNRVTLQTARSCPHRCSFCASGVLLRGTYRRKPLELVQRDLQAIHALWPRPFLELADDNTFVDHRWGRELAGTLEPFDAHWFTETDITVADDEELLAALARSGCRQLLIGLETPDRASLAALEDAPFKAPRAAGTARAVSRIQEHGISVNGCFILGLDEHTPAHCARVVDYAQELGLADVQVTVLTPFPGTPLRRRLEAEGRLLARDDWGACTLFDVTFRPARMSPVELEEALREALIRLYTAERVSARRRHFLAQARARRAATRWPAVTRLDRRS